MQKGGQVFAVENASSRKHFNSYSRSSRSLFIVLDRHLSPMSNSSGCFSLACSRTSKGFPQLEINFPVSVEFGVKILGRNRRKVM